MFYNIHTGQIASTYPTSLVLSNGTLLSASTGIDIYTLAECGWYTVRTDNLEHDIALVEDESLRSIVIDKPYVDISRTWIPKTKYVPENISARQVRLWLISNNISLSQIDTIINSIEDTSLREKTKVEWEYAPYIERNHPLVDNLGLLLGLSSSQLDDAFIAASLL
jgi:hypothetical protein